MASEDKKGINELADTFENFVTKCTNINKSYIEKHYELMTVFFGFKALHSRFSILQRAVGETLEYLQKKIDKSSKDFIDQEMMRQLLKEQQQMAYQIQLFDNDMSKITEKYGEQLGFSKDDTRLKTPFDRFVEKIYEAPSDNVDGLNIEDFGSLIDDGIFSELGDNIKEELKKQTFDDKPIEELDDDDFWMKIIYQLSHSKKVIEELLSDYNKFYLYSTKQMEYLFSIISNPFNPVLILNENEVTKVKYESKGKGAIQVVTESKDAGITWEKEIRLCIIYSGTEIALRKFKTKLSGISENKTTDDDGDVGGNIIKSTEIKKIDGDSGKKFMAILQLPLKYRLYQIDNTYYLKPIESRLLYSIDHIFNKITKQGDGVDYEGFYLYIFDIRGNVDEGKYTLVGKNDLEYIKTDVKEDKQKGKIGETNHDENSATKTLIKVFKHTVTEKDYKIKEGEGNILSKEDKKIILKLFMRYVNNVLGNMIKTSEICAKLAGPLAIEINRTTPPTEEEQQKLFDGMESGNILEKMLKIKSIPNIEERMKRITELNEKMNQTSATSPAK